ncbi:hypothetical protein EDD85DRAFT_980855 [Armillaria nabsnona]|nr:hypothetical protein EDD85DRAFT_980855 [Armillaria nabsnona]
MSSIVLPSRGQCIQITHDSQHCQCLWFFPPESSLLDPTICSHCGHSIHTHADYVLIVINHYPVNQCAVYAQMTYLMQFCTCGAQFYKHNGIYNLYHILEPGTVFRYFNLDGDGSSPSAVTSRYSDANTSPFPLSTMSYDYNTAILSGNTRNMALTPMPISSPSASSNPSPAIQPNATQTPVYSSDGYFTQYPPYAGQAEGGVMNESFEYQGYGNAMYAEPPEGWLGSLGT